MTFLAGWAYNVGYGLGAIFAVIVVVGIYALPAILAWVLHRPTAC